MAEPGLEEMRAFLDAHHMLTLATVGAQGEPQAADLYYAMAEGMQMCFISASSSRHSANIGRDGRVACTIHAVSTRWRDIRGIQLEGTCARMTALEEACAWSHYIARFPFVISDSLLRAALDGVTIYRITPCWLRWIDNSIGLGHKVEYRV